MPIVGAVMAGIGAIGSLLGGIFGGSARKDSQYAAAALTDKQADLQQQQLDESLRRTGLENRQAIGGARATAGASGFWAGGGSMQKYVQAFTNELNTRLLYSKKIGQEQVGLTRESANVQRQAADAGFEGDIFGGMGGLFQGASGVFGSLKLGVSAPPSSSGPGMTTFPSIGRL